MKPPPDLLSEAHGLVLGHKERRQIMDSHGGTKLTRNFPGRQYKYLSPAQAHTHTHTCAHTHIHTHRHQHSTVSEHKSPSGKMLPST